MDQIQVFTNYTALVFPKHGTSCLSDQTEIGYGCFGVSPNVISRKFAMQVSSWFSKAPQSPLRRPLRFQAISRCFSCRPMRRSTNLHPTLMWKRYQIKSGFLKDQRQSLRTKLCQRAAAQSERFALADAKAPAKGARQGSCEPPFPKALVLPLNYASFVRLKRLYL
jgi:hypothetical protein